MAKSKILTLFLCLAVSLILLSSYTSAWNWFWEDDDHDDEDHGCSLCDIDWDWDCDLCDDDHHDDEDECGWFDDCDDSPEGYYEWTYENGKWKKIYTEYEHDDCYDNSYNHYESYESYNRYDSNTRGCTSWDRWGNCDSELSKNLRIKTYAFETELIADDGCDCNFFNICDCDERDRGREVGYALSSYEARQQRRAAETNSNRWFKPNNQLWTL